jgi:hypothetical protein
MELNEEKKMKSEQAALPNPCLEEEWRRRRRRRKDSRNVVVVQADEYK